MLKRRQKPDLQTQADMADAKDQVWRIPNPIQACSHLGTAHWPSRPGEGSPGGRALATNSVCHQMP